MGSKRKPGRHVQRSVTEAAEIAQLEAQLREGAPPKGTSPLALDAATSTSYAGARTFEELPLSRYTKDALKEAGFVRLTAIQRAALPHALCGRDILGAAKTGSGKTLAFLIPVVEKLYRLRWTRLDGLGGLILTPTRELAVQIFQELRKVGKYQELSAGLLIGGKGVKEEQERVARMNILVATPGRLLQHMDETPGFDTAQLVALVLDEADRILDLGFAATLDAILANLPPAGGGGEGGGRQTMLFSATQTKSVRDLARLSLSEGNAEWLAVHAQAEAPTPLKLQQSYMVVPLGEKLNVLWSFIKAHLACKTIVFLSTCKQVRFLFAAFKKLRPGVPLACLHGGMKQAKRTAAWAAYCDAKAAVLICTDIAARGLDFPSVHWVVQLDCPEDVATYIHRVGRTARYTAGGRALLLLEPSEQAGMLGQLAAGKVPIKEIRMQASKAQPVSPALAALLSKSVELKEMGQRAVTSYLRSVFLQPNKAVFDVTRLPVAEYAQAMGLLAAPKLRFLKKAGKGQGRLLKGLPEARGSSGAAAEDSSLPPGGGDDDDAPSDGAGHAVAAAPRAAASKRKAVGGSEEQPAGGAGASSSGRDDGDDGDELLVVKKRDVFATEAGGAELAIAAAVGAAEERRKKRKLLKIKLGKMAGNRTVFDAEGRAMEPLALLAANGLGAGEGGEEGLGEAAGNEGMTAEERFRAAAALMRVRDRQDKAEIKALRKEMRRAAKARQRAAREAEMGGGDGDYGVVLGRGSDDDKKEEERQEESEEGGRSSSGASGSSSSGDAGASGTDSDSGDSGGAESSEVASMSEGASEEEQAATRRGRQKLQQHSSGVVASGGSKRSADAPIAPSNTGKGAAGASNKRAKTVESLSLAEAEALVLARLTSGKTAS